LQQERERAEEKKHQDSIQKARNMRAPHLTNLNEDLQLSGKMLYSLEECQDGREFHIGRHDGDPVPNIVLRGVGIQRNHAHITLSETGIFEISAATAESYEQTLVNGKRLQPSSNTGTT
jgi:pSer/pThr/pTyr-binding forkhead associated (FHA) protein